MKPVRAGVAGLLALRLWGMRFVRPTLSSFSFLLTLIRLYIVVNSKFDIFVKKIVIDRAISKDS